MLEKIKAYYRNSPTRVRITWGVIHVAIFFWIFQTNVLFTNVGMQYLLLFFPSVAFFPFFNVAYYGLLIAVMVLAKNTLSRSFIITHRIFLALFILSIADLALDVIWSSMSFGF